MRGVMRDCKPDLELARRAAGGDETAWREIFERTGNRLFAFLCYQVGNREEALDLVQETYVVAFRRGLGPCHVPNVPDRVAQGDRLETNRSAALEAHAGT